MRSDDGAGESVCPVPARRHHADLGPVVHEGDDQALRLEVPERQRRLVIEARVVGRLDPPLRAVEEPLRRRAQPSRDLYPKWGELLFFFYYYFI